MMDEEKIEKDISSFVAAYAGGKLVTSMLSQAVIPPSIMYSNVYHESIQELAHLMKNARSEMVRYSAANSLAEKLAPPEVAKVQLDVTHHKADEVTMLQDTIRELATAQMKAIREGTTSVRDVAEAKIVHSGVMD
jgi:hypothetical protein